MYFMLFFIFLSRLLTFVYFVTQAMLGIFWYKKKISQLAVALKALSSQCLDAQKVLEEWDSNKV